MAAIHNLVQFKPSKIHFTQDSIAVCFKDGTSVEDTIDELAHAWSDLEAEDTKPIKVFKKGDSYYSKNNRRLYMFRVLEVGGQLDTIGVNLIPAYNQRVMLSDGSTGCHIKIRGNLKPFRHCYCWEQRQLALYGADWEVAVPSTSSAVTRYESTSSSQNSGTTTEDVVKAGLVVAGVAAVGFLAYQMLKTPTASFSPARIRFSQDSIAWSFRSGGDVNLTIFKIASGKLKASDIERMDVVKKANGTIVSADNRRLYVFRVLNLMGILDKIEVNVIDHLSRTETTTSTGCHVTMRGDTTYQHCTCLGQRASLPGWWNARYGSIRYDMLSSLEKAALSQSSKDECVVM